MAKKTGNKKNEYYTVEFETFGGTQIASQTIKNGTKAVQPYSPIKDGAEFFKWYYMEEIKEKNQSTEIQDEDTEKGNNTDVGDDEDENENQEDVEVTYQEVEFDFNTEIRKNYTLYAKYTGEAVLMSAHSNNNVQNVLQC